MIFSESSEHCYWQYLQDGIISESSEHFCLFVSVNREQIDIQFSSVGFRDDVSNQNWNLYHADV